MNAEVSRPGTPPAPWRFVCPMCRDALEPLAGNLHCSRCERDYRYSSGIWRLLPNESSQHYHRFLNEYGTVRKDQGWGRPDADYFLALPDVADDDPQREIWRRRRRSSNLAVGRVVAPMSGRLQRPLRVLDLGAGNSWLSYRLATLGHQVAAIDISDDPIDGLGAHRWYYTAAGHALPEPAVDGRFTPIQAEFDRLPFEANSAEVVLFNGSLHYSTDYDVTLREALRVLVPDGVVVIMDTPVYRSAVDGEAMVRERETAFERQYGLRSNSMQAEHFLTPDRLDSLARDLTLRWQQFVPSGRAGWRIREQMRGRWRRVRGLRQLATMPVIAGYRAMEP